MKYTRFSLVLIIILVCTGVSLAQRKIERAFANIIENTSFHVSQKCSSERDPSTGAKISQCDVYNFTIPVKNKNFINGVISAFKDDEKYAYYIYSGHFETNDEFEIGYGKTNELPFAESGHDFYIASFMAPTSDDPEGINRYCYAISYTEQGKEIKGKLVITYGTTPQYRDRLVTGQNNSDSYGLPVSWFSKFMTYVNALPVGNYQQRSGIATKIYEMSQQVPDSVPSADLLTAQDVLNTTLNNGYEEIVKTLLTSTSKNLGVLYEKRRKGEIYIK